ncbi:aminoglycoside phosphotransferase family protein [Streptomyces sp. NPDC029526]|uniref:aminoglycoside phosphotransferase family protein n=1 Tax=Streptomyces sp. NPDC029526 TaxID=3155728 RepID=UPI0033FFDFFD
MAYATRHGTASSGHHNRNYVTPLGEPEARLLGREPGSSVTVRIRRAEALPVVIRTWDDEDAILGAVGGVLPHVPQCLAKGPGFAVHSYVEGVPLSSVCGNGKPVDTLLVRALAELLARMTQVRRGALPPLPDCWPRGDTDSRQFLRTLAHLADRQIRRPNRAVFGALFTALGIEEDALARFADRVPAMAPRPYSLLHADLHRDNLIVTYGGTLPLICVDWELATYGDPLHDLATHLVRMRYPAHQWDEVVEAWQEAMGALRPAGVDGLGKDLSPYVAFERAQSVFPDVMRAAQSLEQGFSQKGLDEATAEVGRALETAAQPLHLRSVPGARGIEGALFRWLTARRVRRGEPRAAVFGWEPDRRLPLPRDIDAAAVLGALAEEKDAPAGRVFEGTAHLTTVVRMPGFDHPVVVRRRLPGACTRKPRFLSEHAVLRRIEEAGVDVTAPRALALGETPPNDRFALHTYLGPRDLDRPPQHPVDGLSPREADSLVDQLCALTRVDHEHLDPAAAEVGFHRWLTDEVVRLVGELPRRTRQLARQLGLPDAPRLGHLLSRDEVGHREPALLHGDLHPWNLVRQAGSGGLALIDWEMALIGDPLHDLVRHMHLTPTSPELRDRLFRRWEQRLPPEHTRGWREDWRVYRRLEAVRSAYVDLDRIVTGSGLGAPHVRRAVDSYPVTLAVATGALGLPVRCTANPFLARALA